MCDPQLDGDKCICSSLLMATRRDSASRRWRKTGKTCTSIMCMVLLRHDIAMSSCLDHIPCMGRWL